MFGSHTAKVIIMPHRESLPANWRKIDERYKLTGNRCINCNENFFPARQVCLNCRRTGKLEEYTFSGEGTVQTFTKIYAPPRGFEEDAPYELAIIKLKEGPSVTGQIIKTSHKTKIGSKVQSEFRKVSQDGTKGMIHYGFKFKVIE